MTPPVPPECLAGNEALARGAWEEARRSFEAVLRVREFPEALEGLGMAAWWLDLADLVFDARERAYRLYVARDDRAPAARLAVWLAWDYSAFRGENAVANGWLQRARHLLEGLPACAERAWLQAREGVLCLADGSDPTRARALAVETIQSARQAANTDMEMLGRAVEGLALVTAGTVSEGMSTLDEVNAAVIAGELTDLVAIGLAGCYMVAACERARDCDRAVQWCRRLKLFAAKWGLHPLFAVCRTQYASICLWQGTWQEAEEELRAAKDELAACRPAMVPDALERLAELRRRQGRLDEAEAIFEQAHPSGASSLRRAEIAYDRGNPQAAAEQVARYLRQVSVCNRTARAIGLELQVRALADIGDVEHARFALSELQSIADLITTSPFKAAASYASGYLALATGDADQARQFFEDAVDLFLESGAPFEVARARIELGRALKKLGRDKFAVAEVKRAIALLTNLKAEAEKARAQNVLNDLGGVTAARRSPVSKAENGPLTTREIEVLCLVAEGLNNQTIAQRLFLSDHTVHRHLANILCKLNVPTRAAAVAQASRQGLLR